MNNSTGVVVNSYASSLFALPRLQFEATLVRNRIEEGPLTYEKALCAGRSLRRDNHCK
jgi:hypothetical protein